MPARPTRHEVADFFSQPPVEQVRRIYSIEEVKRSARIRDSVRRLEIGGLTFDSGKATISRNQVGALSNVANAMLALLDRNPAETFLIEGHTDAVGSEISNLGLSDLRASTVARILTDFYDIPPENLVTQGYGERYLKVRTEAAERLNRRVQIRRITPLITLWRRTKPTEIERRMTQRAGSNPGPSRILSPAKAGPDGWVTRDQEPRDQARSSPAPTRSASIAASMTAARSGQTNAKAKTRSRMPSAERHHRADPRDAREDEPGAVVVALRRVGADEAEDERRDGRQEDRQDEAEDQAGDADPAEQLRIVGWRPGRIVSAAALAVTAIAMVGAAARAARQRKNLPRHAAVARHEVDPHPGRRSIGRPPVAGRESVAVAVVTEDGAALCRRVRFENLPLHAVPSGCGGNLAEREATARTDLGSGPTF